MNQDMKVVVTGASRGLGKAVLKHLSQINGLKIKGVYREIPKPAEKSIENELFIGDIRDTLFLDEIAEWADLIIHCAGLVSYQTWERQSLFTTNQKATGHLVDAAINHSTRLIHISSTAAIGFHETNPLLDDIAIPDPEGFITDYAESKWYGELEVHRGITEGLDAVIIAPSIIIGPPEYELQTAVFVEQAEAGMKYCPSGSNGFVDIKDLVEVIAKCVFEKPKNSKYIANGFNMKWIEFFNSLQGPKINAQAIPIPSFLIGLVYLKAWLFSIFGIRNNLPKSVLKVFQADFSYHSNLLTDEFKIKFRDSKSTLASMLIK